MRTTVTLDPELVNRLKKLAHQRGASFKSAINAVIRAGLDAETTGGRPYREKSRPLGVQPGVDLTKALQLAAALEDEETIRELEMRK